MKKEELKEIIVESILEALYQFTNQGVMMMSSSQEGDEGEDDDEGNGNNPPDTIPTPNTPPPDTVPAPRPGPLNGPVGFSLR